MPTPMHALSNNYNECHLLKLDPDDHGSPYVVAQEAYDPDDETCRMRMFYLQRDGQWIDEIARSTRPDTEAGDILFETSAEALELLGGLTGKPVIRDLPTTEEDVRRYIARLGGGSSPQELLRQFVARYRAAKGDPQ